MQSSLCPCCGKPVMEFTEFGCAWPKARLDVPAAERATRCGANAPTNADLCDVDRKRWFVRGVLAIRLLDSYEPPRMGWGIWAEVEHDVLQAYAQAMSRGEEFECEGRLSVEPLGKYDQLDGARVHIHDAVGQQRPYFTLLEHDNPSRARLHCQQTNGITLAQAHEIFMELFPDLFGSA